MNRSRNFIGDVLQTGAVATATTTMAATAFGQMEENNAIAPLNSVSHIAWGDKAAHRDGASWKYTATGTALNAAAVTSWAALYELFFGRRGARGDVGGALLGGAIVSGLAYVVDYHVVPKRFTPGFEKRLSNGALLGIYGALAAGLALGGLMKRD
jgi:hypothetical protein